MWGGKRHRPNLSSNVTYDCGVPVGDFFERDSGVEQTRSLLAPKTGASNDDFPYSHETGVIRIWRLSDGNHQIGKGRFGCMLGGGRYTSFDVLINLAKVLLPLSVRNTMRPAEDTICRGRPRKHTVFASDNSPAY